MQENQSRFYFITMAALLVYAVFLQWAGQVNIDIDEQHSGMTGSMWSWVVDRHPPFAGFVGYLWGVATGFSTIAFFALSKLNALLALWVIYLLNLEFLKPRLALLGVAAYSATFPFVSMMTTLDNNSVLHALWPATVLFTWRGLNHGRWLDWGYAGILMGLCFLSKYHSLIFGACLLAACFLVFAVKRNWQWAKLGLACGLALALFAPHILSEYSHGFQTLEWAQSSADGVTNAGPDGRLSIPTFLASNALYNLFGTGLLVFLAWRHGWLKFTAPRTANDKSIWHFLLVMAALFPAFPVLLSAVFGISLKATWGFNAFFLLPTLVLWVGARASADAFSEVTWRRFVTVVPAYLALMTTLVIANGFTNASRPLALQDTIHEVDRIWSINTDVPIELSVAMSETAVGMTFYSRFHPKLKLSGTDPERGTWLLNEERCYERGTVILWGGRTDWRDRNGQQPAFDAEIEMPARWTNLTWTKPVYMYMQAFPDGICF